MIAVCIATYNQEAYIAQAVESVLMQECDEPLRIYIGDDASTDDTSAICERLAATDNRIRYYRRTQNMGLVNNTLELYRQIMTDGCEYIAMLDGDDYWTDPNKLQLQMDYLRSHPEVGFIHTSAYEENNGEKSLMDDADIPVGDISKRYNLSGARQTNCTVFFRTDLLRKVNLETIQTQAFPVLDYPLYGLFSQYTEFAFLPVPTAVWRNHSSVSQPSNWFNYIHYRHERLRMWKWLDGLHPNSFHFDRIKAHKWLIRQNFSFFIKKISLLFAYIRKN